MDQKHIAAFTAFNCDYPAFVSINTDSDGAVLISVRSPKNDDGSCGTYAAIRLTDDQFGNLMKDVIINQILAKK
jgi:hypothetical protein